MSIYESLRLSLNAIRSHKLRSVLTTLGIMIGVMTVIGMLALIDGLDSMVSTQLAALGSNTLYVQKFPWQMSRQEMLELGRRRNITMDDYEAIRRELRQARRVAPMLTISRTVRFEGRDLTGVEVIGTVAEYQFIADFQIEAGRQMLDLDLSQQRPVAMIGATVAEELFPQRDPLGKNIQVGNHRFTIIAVLDERGTLFGQDQDNVVIVPVTTFMQYFTGPITATGEQSITVVVEPESPEMMSDLRSEIIGILRRRRGLGPGEENDFAINTAEQLMETYRTITSGVYALMIGVTSLSLIVGGIGIMNIMLVSVSERIREIGIRKAVGAKRRDIRNQFLIEAITLSVVGGIIGMILGFVIAWLISAVTAFPAAVSWWSVFLGFGFSVLVGVFFGWYPASRASTMSPIEALRYE
ncbi:MAG: ABC transporter permease [Chitinispirillaceae bacterium]